MTGLVRIGKLIATKLQKLLSLVILFMLIFYQRCISPLLGGGKCRFYPTCSDYAYQAIDKYGFIYGTILSLGRILRCGPWSKGGYDPLPDRNSVGFRIWLGNLKKWILNFF